jgi:hypothetical protein
MALKTSTGLRNKMLDTGSVRATLAGGFMKIYSGSVPATADAALTGGNVLLCTISVNSTGTGLTFATTATSGVLVKNSSEVWSGVNGAGGTYTGTATATFYRFVTSADDGTLSVTQPRIQGDIAVAGSELNLTNVNLVAGATQTIDYYAVAIPTL